MAPTMIARIDRGHIGQALHQLRQACRYQPDSMRRINMAATELHAVVWQWNGHELRIRSRTHENVQYYVNEHGCTCQAGTHGRNCWHMDAWRLLERATQIANRPAPKPMSDTQYAQVQAACDELF